MCGRFEQDVAPGQLQIDFAALADVPEDAVTVSAGAPDASRHVRPTAPVLTVSTVGDGYVVAPAVWALRPAWMKQPPQQAMINARAETLVDKPSFRQSAMRHRTVIPATAYFEWATIDGAKHVHRFTLPGESRLWMAGILAPPPRPGNAPPRPGRDTHAEAASPKTSSSRDKASRQPKMLRQDGASARHEPSGQAGASAPGNAPGQEGVLQQAALPLQMGKVAGPASGAPSQGPARGCGELAKVGQRSAPWPTTAIITTTAPHDLAWVHDRAPLLLPPSFVTTWLDPALSDTAAITEFWRSIPPPPLVTRPCELP